MGQYRTARVAHLIQEKIGTLILDGCIKDPRVDSFLSVTRVDVSKDLSYADVFISGYKSRGDLVKSVAGLSSAAGYIQSLLAASMHIRATPRLRFHADTGIQEAFVLNQKIDALVKTSSGTKPAADYDIAVP
ncbi:MAG: 30S ribosome-binding factor RbfA [Spirochaetaceae bacterium]|jgi:ribosome-binding factor A|nr:30S ribosome-binding factor RbfA [Spirochaetaceae bacterium]